MQENLLHIAIVDDDSQFLHDFMDLLMRAAHEIELEVRTACFSDAVDFVSNYTADFDVIFIDVEMPGLDGFEAARRIRVVDCTVCIVFITKMAQYAIRGYEVNALDYMVKPVGYIAVAEKLRRVADYCSTRRDGTVLLEDGNQFVRVSYSQIWYIEKRKNYILYHTVQGELRQRGTLGQCEASFVHCGFGRCTHGCLVNYAFVDKTSRDTVWVAGQFALPISRARRQDFMNGLIRYIGGGY